MEDYHQRFGHMESLRKNGAKERCMQVCQDIEHFQTEPGLHTAQQSPLVMRHGFFCMIWKPSAKAVSGRPQCRQGQRKQDSQSKVKDMLITFFDMRGIIYSEFLPWDQMIN